MSDDIVTRLRKSTPRCIMCKGHGYLNAMANRYVCEPCNGTGIMISSVEYRAADEIERLQLLVEAWRSEALFWHSNKCANDCDCLQLLDKNISDWSKNYD